MFWLIQIMDRAQFVQLSNVKCLNLIQKEEIGIRQLMQLRDRLWYKADNLLKHFFPQLMEDMHSTQEIYTDGPELLIQKKLWIPAQILQVFLICKITPMIKIHPGFIAIGAQDLIMAKQGESLS